MYLEASNCRCHDCVWKSGRLAGTCNKSFLTMCTRAACSRPYTTTSRTFMCVSQAPIVKPMIGNWEMIVNNYWRTLRFLSSVDFRPLYQLLIFLIETPLVTSLFVHTKRCNCCEKNFWITKYVSLLSLLCFAQLIYCINLWFVYILCINSQLK